jgi:hypothetical protein
MIKPMQYQPVGKPNSGRQAEYYPTILFDFETLMM